VNTISAGVNQQQPQRRVDVALPIRRQPDQVLVALVGADAAHEQQVGVPVVERPQHDRVGPLAVAREVEVDRQHAGGREAGLLQL
jgi:hypothetical protein